MKFLILILFSIACLISIASCDDSDTKFYHGPNSEDGIVNSPTEIIPMKDWGASQSEVKSSQNKGLLLAISTDSLLRYSDKMQEIIIDYNFKNDKLSGTSLTQAGISSINDIVECWLKDYKQLVKSETTLLYVSSDNSTLAYGKILKGSKYKYASIAWTYIDENEGTSDEPDFSPSGQENGYSYVDLGVGIGWAVQNVDASSPEKSGGYYMWGETVTRTNCWWWYYSLYNGDINSYLDEDSFYSPYSNISGTNYDAAKKRMGGNWRMPTRAEFYTLINNCEFRVGKYNGISGFIVTGPSGKSIFLPATGLKKKDEIRLTSSIFLWSATTYGSADAYHLNYKTENLEDSNIAFMGKYYGMPIRGVINLK